MSPRKSQSTILEVAQFVLLLHNQKMRDVTRMIGSKGVLIIGSFQAGRQKKGCSRTSGRW
ncbi:MAG: hypothetical protein ACRD8O_11550 [Bryobacteraceae bacterium]